MKEERWPNRLIDTLVYLAGLLLMPCGSLSAAGSVAPALGLPVFRHQTVVLDYKDLRYNPSNDVIYPSIVEAHKYFTRPLGRYYLYYAPHNAPGGICLAYADALSGPWREYSANPVITREWPPHYKVSHVSGPDAIWSAEEKKLFLYFHGENPVTRLASSADGIHFDYEGSVVTTDMFDQVSEASYGRMFRYTLPGKDNRYIMLLMGNNRETRSIYLAWSKDGRHWETRRTPVMDPPPGTDQVAGAWYLPWQGRHYLIAHANRAADPGSFNVNFNLYVAEVDAAFEQTKHLGLFYSRAAVSADNEAVMSPCIVAEGSKLCMFINIGPRLHNKIALAVADIPAARAPLAASPDISAGGTELLPAGYSADALRIVESVPAPLYRDPVYDGAADPVLVWNPGARAWWMLYTQRRAKLDLPGVEWCHQTEIGVAESRDDGMTWVYLGTLTLSHPDAGYSFWAPDVIREDSGRYHLFVSYVPGAADTHRHWGGQRHILHYRSDDLWHWTFEQRVPVSSDASIDPTLVRRPDGSWRMWYKDEGHNSDTFAVESRDLKEWKPMQDPGVSKLYGEGPKVFRFQGSYWLIKDPGKGLDVYRSPDLESWTYQGKILDKPGRRNDDAAPGQHADVVVRGDRAYIIYFTHPYGQDFPLKNGIMPLAARHSSLQAAELEVRDGKLVCDRDKPFRLQLTEQGSSPQLQN